MLVIAGCCNSGWEKILPVFPERSDFSEYFLKICPDNGATAPLETCQSLAVDPLLQGEVVKWVAARQGIQLVIADSRNAGLLDFWAERFPETRFLLFYDDLARATAKAFLSGIDPQSFLACWLATNRHFLAFQRRNRQRTILLRTESAIQAPDKMLELLQQQGVSLPLPAPAGTDAPCEELPAEGLLAGILSAGQPEARLLAGELTASAHPLGITEFPQATTPAALFSQYQQKNRLEAIRHHHQQLTEEMAKARAELTQKDRTLLELESQRHNLVQENELLLLQLRQVQEELETVFFQKQQLEIAVQRSEPASPVTVADNPGAGLEHQPEVDAASTAGHTPSSGFFKKFRGILSGEAKRKERAKQELAARIQLLRESGLFNEDWYLQRYTDVAKAGIDPLKHYLGHGAAEGRDPSPDFDTRYYMTANPDVVASGINPLVHYVLYGAKEGRKKSLS